MAAFVYYYQARNGVPLTDGAGKILRSYASEVLQLDPLCDVVQFRYNTGSNGPQKPTSIGFIT